MNDQDEEPSAEDQLHGALCALALGELTGAEAHELELRIASESSLQAQYAEIQATIRLVRGSLDEEAALPPAHMARVVEASQRSVRTVTPRSWYRSPAVRLAAGLVVCAGAGLVGLTLMQDRELALGDQRTAAGPPPAATPAHDERARSSELRRSLERKDELSALAVGEAPNAAPLAEAAKGTSSFVGGAGSGVALGQGVDTSGALAFDALAPSERAVRLLTVQPEATLRGLGYFGAPSETSAATAPGRPAVTTGLPGLTTATNERYALGGGVADGALRERLKDTRSGETNDFYLSLPGSPPDAGRVIVIDFEGRWRALHRDCQLGPGERPRDMHFRFWGDNAFVRTAEDAQSTFGADVDTASYALARRYLREGHAPEAAQIRTEEFVNAFTPDLAPPLEDTFHLSLELAPTLFGESANHWLVRVGVRGKEVAKEAREPLALTFVIDTSGSMREQNRLELVKHALRLLVTQLDARDTIAIVAYSNEARQILGPTSAARRDLIESALFPLSPNGSTNAEAGLRMGYALAETMLATGTHHRVVFLSDGVANVGQTDQDRINADVQRFRQSGIYLNTIGVGMNNHNDVFLEQLANKGDGICDYVDDAKAAEKAIVQRFTGAFVPIASDVKLQVEFDPQQVLRWRQLGYENRAIADQDFRNDAVDAGEVGAGHQVTCLYEIELAPGLSREDAERALATLRVRWKAPKVAHQNPLEHDVFEREARLGYGAAAASFRAASFGFRRSALAAQFAEFLRRSVHTQRDDYGVFVTEVGALLDSGLADAGQRTDAPVAAELIELADLVRRADGLGFGRPLPQTELERALEEFKRFQYRRAVEGPGATDDSERERCEGRLREALRRELGVTGD